MENIGPDLLNQIMMCVAEQHSVPDLLGWDIKKRRAYSNFYDMSILDSADNIRFYDDDYNIISITEYLKKVDLPVFDKQIVLKRMMEVELVTKRISVPGWYVTITDLNCVYMGMDVRNFALLRVFEELTEMGICTYDNTLHRYRDNFEIRIGGILFQVDEYRSW